MRVHQPSKRTGIMPKVAKMLRQKRLERGLTQEQLENRSGVSWITILRIERSASCNLETLDLIAEGLNCDLVIEFRERDKKW